MMLRSISKHLKEQNWLAIVLDLMIVVLGVFIAFQVDAWNEKREARVAERATLLRLQAEAQEVVAYWRMEVLQQEKFNANRLTLLQVLDTGTMIPQQQPAVDDAFMRLGHYPQFNPPRSVYEELISSGGLSQISAPRIRSAVADYAAELDFVMGQLTQFRSTLPMLYAAYDGHVFSEYDQGVSSMRRFTYDISELSRDRQFVSAIVDGVRDQLQFLTIRAGILERAITMCESISEATGLTCDAPEINEERIRARDGVNQ